MILNKLGNACCSEAAAVASNSKCVWHYFV